MEFEELKLVLDRIKDLQHVKGEYKEPLLNSETVVFMKASCDRLGQGSHVFFHAIEVLDRYVRAKNEQKVQLEDPVLISCTCILTSSKHQGGRRQLSLKHIKTYLSQVSFREYTTENVSNMESDILTTLINSSEIPATTIMDDLDTVVAKFLIEVNLRVKIMRLSISVLIFAMIMGKELFADLQKFYSSNERSKELFRDLACSKLYIPVGVLMTTLNFKYGTVFDIDTMLFTFSKYYKIDYNHLNLVFTSMFESLKVFFVKTDIDYSDSRPSF